MARKTKLIDLPQPLLLIYYSEKLYKNDVKNMVDKQKEIVLLKKLSSIKNEDLHIFSFVLTNLNSRIFIFFLKCRRGRVFKFHEYSVKRLD